MASFIKRKKTIENYFKKITLYPVTCEDLSAGRSDLEVLKQVMLAGVKIIQLRDKNSKQNDFLTKAKIFRKVTQQFGALLIINDHFDIALEIQADGVHLGQSDLPLCEAEEKLFALPNTFSNQQLKEKFIIGVSCHSLEQALKAEKEGASYINIGPIFDTETKKNKDGLINKGLGIEIIKQIKSQLKIPFTVMGGIKEKHIQPLLSYGAKHIAMITEITQSPNIKTHTKYLLSLFNEY